MSDTLNCIFVPITIQYLDAHLEICNNTIWIHTSSHICNVFLFWYHSQICCQLYHCVHRHIWMGKCWKIVKPILIIKLMAGLCYVMNYGDNMLFTIWSNFHLIMTSWYPHYWPFVRGIHRSYETRYTDVWCFVRLNKLLNKLMPGNLRRHDARVLAL